MDFIKSQIKKHHQPTSLDLFDSLNWSQHFSINARSIFSVAKSFEFGLPGKVTTIAYDPLQSFLAVGTASGSLHLWGGPGVYLSWKNRPAHHIKHLCFKPGSSLLCCIDIKDTLYVYNLNSIQDGVPFRECSHSIRSVVMCFAISPAHSHLFLGLKDGTVDCFDLDRGVTSPYRIRNLWLEHDELLRRSGVPGAPSRRHIPVCTDLKFHPLDLNLLLIAHEGGISLYDLKQQTVLMSYELVIPPGAIGSTRNGNSPLVFEERRPSVTCLAFRPDGEMFVSGHLDGCLAFWSLEDGDMPLLVRTMEREDVLMFDWGEAEGGASHEPTNSKLPPREEAVREPIFRIAWSAFPTGSSMSKEGTLLTVLGGLMTGDPVGVHVVHLPASQDGTATREIGSEARGDLLASTCPIGHSIYFTSETPEDFLLIPRSNPYFDGSFDPISIIISTGANFDVPDHLSRRVASNGTVGVDHQSLSDRTLRSFTFPPKLNEEVKECQLPGAFDWIGSNTVIACEVFELTEEAFRKLCEPSHHTNSGEEIDRLPLKGGMATVSPSFLEFDGTNQGQSSELIKEFQNKFRVMVTVHMNKKIRFWDFSMRLLLPIDKGTLSTEFPARLDHLTIDLSTFLNHTSNLFPEQHLEHPLGIFLSSESLDLVLTFSDLDLLVFTYHQAKFISPQVTGDRSEVRNSGLSINATETPVVHEPKLPTKDVSADGSSPQASGPTQADGPTEAREPPQVNEHTPAKEPTPLNELSQANAPPQEKGPGEMTAETAELNKVMADAANDLSKDASLPLTTLTEPESQTLVSDDESKPPGELSKPLEVVAEVPSSDQLAEPAPDHASNTQTEPAISRPSSPAVRCAPPPPRPPRSVRRVNESSRSRSRPHTPEVHFRAELTPAKERVPVSVGLDISEIQGHYEGRNGFRPVMWVPQETGDGKVSDTSVALVSRTGSHQQELVVALSDMGFLAVAQLDQSRVRVYDLRNMKILFDDHIIPNGKGKSKSQEKRVRCLKWTVSALYTDALILPRLLVGYDDGSFDTLKLYLSQSHMIDSWTATALSNDSFGKEKSEKARAELPIGCFVFGGRHGQIQLTNLANLQAALSDGIRNKPVTEGEHESEKTIGAISVVVTCTSVVVRLEINGPTLMKKDDVSSEPIIKATIITYQDSCALLLIDEKRTCYVLSLPRLDLICKTFLPVLNGVDVLGRLAIDSSGDVIEQIDFSTTHLTTLLVGRDSAYTPSVNAHDHTIRTPEPPQPKSSALASASALASNLVSWFQANTTGGQPGTANSPRVTGAELDTILAGPQRPEKRRSALQPPRLSQSRTSHVVVPSGVGSSSSSTQTDTRQVRRASAAGSKDQMAKNINELDERGERLENLNERFDELSNATSQLVQQAKRIGQQQSAKASFSSGFSGVKSFFK